MKTKEDRPSLSTEVSRLESEVGPHARHPLVHLRVFEQLKQRNVSRAAVLYEITPEGLKPTVEAPHGQSICRLTRRRLDLAIVAVLIGAPVSIITVSRGCP